MLREGESQRPASWTSLAPSIADGLWAAADTGVACLKQAQVEWPGLCRVRHCLQALLRLDVNYSVVYGEVVG